MTGWKSLEEEIEGAANDAYYMSPSMIKFLLVENLAIKTLLHEKGILDPKEFREHQQKAAKILDEKTKNELKAHLKGMAERLRQGDGSLLGNKGGGSS